MARDISIREFINTSYYPHYLGLVQVTDELIVIPSRATNGLYAVILDRYTPLPGSDDTDLQLWTGVGRTGTQYTIENWSVTTHGDVPVPSESQTVVLVQSDSLVSFHSDDAGTTVYASYKGGGSTLTSWDCERIMSMARAAGCFEAHVAGPSIAAGTLVSIFQETGGYPVIRKAEADVPGSMPAVGFVPETIATNGIGIVLMSGILIGQTALTPGTNLFVGTDGLITYEGDGHFPTAGQILQRAGVVLTSTKAFINLDQGYTTA
jgi:hypothetical protein